MFENLIGQQNFSLERLATLCAVADAGSIGAAAGGDSNKQSQFSRQISELEKFLGTDLLLREAKPYRLTEEGKELSRMCHDYLGGIESFVAQCQNKPRRISIGAGESLIQWWLMPAVMSEIQKTVKGASIIFRNLQTNSIISALSDGEIDLGFVRSTAVPNNLRSIQCAKFSYHLFAPKMLTGKLKSPVDIKELTGLPLAVLEGGGEFRRTLDGLMKSAGHPASYQLECSSSTQIALAISKKGYCGFLPHFAKNQLDSKNIRMLDVKGMKGLDRSLSIVWNPRRVEIRPEIKTVIQLFRKTREKK